MRAKPREYAVKTIIIDIEQCKGCCLCIETCSRKLIEVSDRPNVNGYYPARLKEGAECIACALCATICPDVAIVVLRDDADDQTRE